ncbi:hypothetical protein JOQ06_020288, partial [Pogonophryne albipinna]
DLLLEPILNPDLPGEGAAAYPVGNRISWLEELLDSHDTTLQLHLQHQDDPNHPADQSPNPQQIIPFPRSQAFTLRSSLPVSAPPPAGLMLKDLGKTRGSNAVVENWFRTTKKVGDFLQLQQEFVVGRLKGVAIMKKQ